MGGINPKNLSAQLAYRGAGNPPSTHPSSAISNAFPGLEMDIRNLWRHIFEGIVLHESSNLVVAVDSGNPRVAGLTPGQVRLISVDTHPMTVEVTGPTVAGGDNVPLPDATGATTMPLEWSNALAGVLHDHVGDFVDCVFRSLNGDPDIMLSLRLLPVFEAGQTVIAAELSPPGQLSQSLCSPWQTDYRECACFYWAASRPDYVNIEAGPDGISAGHNWMQRDRPPGSPKVYVVDDWKDPRLLTHEDLFTGWQELLKVEIEGKDAD
jgi:hypothetical protein